jgi:molecular chaperone GrpE
MAEASAPTQDELLDLLRQERADFRNYRQRVADEREAESERTRGRVLEPLLPLLDDLDRALAGPPADLTEHPWVQGIALLRAQLREVERRLGLESVGVTGDAFDPALHEAIAFEPAPDATATTLADVVRPGYRMGGRLLRPAQVVVRGPLATSPGDHDASGDDDATSPPADDKREHANPDDHLAGG